MKLPTHNFIKLPYSLFKGFITLKIKTAHFYDKIIMSLSSNNPQTNKKKLLKVNQDECSIHTTNRYGVFNT